MITLTVVLGSEIVNIPSFPATASPVGSPPEAVLIDSLLSVDQYRGADKATSCGTSGKAARDIAEVAAATELILPKGSFRTTSSVRFTHIKEKRCIL